MANAVTVRGKPCIRVAPAREPSLPTYATYTGRKFTLQPRCSEAYHLHGDGKDRAFTKHHHISCITSNYTAEGATGDRPWQRLFSKSITPSNLKSSNEIFPSYRRLPNLCLLPSRTHAGGIEIAATTVTIYPTRIKQRQNLVIFRMGTIRGST